jgi:hypothetical protein
MTRTLWVLLLLTLSACGADTLGTAAVGAASKERELEQARQTREDVQRQLDAANQLEKQRLENADPANRP